MEDSVYTVSRGGTPVKTEGDEKMPGAGGEGTG